MELEITTLACGPNFLVHTSSGTLGASVTAVMFDSAASERSVMESTLVALDPVARPPEVVSWLHEQISINDRLPSWAYVASFWTDGREAVSCLAGDIRVHGVGGGDHLWMHEDHRRYQPEEFAFLGADAPFIYTHAIGPAYQLAPLVFSQDSRPQLTVVLCSSGIHGSQVPGGYLSVSDAWDLERWESELLVRARTIPNA